MYEIAGLQKSEGILHDSAIVQGYVEKSRFFSFSELITLEFSGEARRDDARRRETRRRETRRHHTLAFQ